MIAELQNSIPDNGNRNHEELLAEIVQLNAKRDSVESANKTLRERLIQYNERERQQDVAREIERLISESALARFAVTELLMQQLLDAPDEKARRALIASNSNSHFSLSDKPLHRSINALQEKVLVTLLLS